MEKSEFFRIMRSEGYPDEPINKIWSRGTYEKGGKNENTSEADLRENAQHFYPVFSVVWAPEFEALNKNKPANVESGMDKKQETQKEMWFRVGREEKYPDSVLVDGYNHLTDGGLDFHLIDEQSEEQHREHFRHFREEAKKMYPAADWEE